MEKSNIADLVGMPMDGDRREGEADNLQTYRFLKSLPQIVRDMMFYGFAHDSSELGEHYLRSCAKHVRIVPIDYFKVNNRECELLFFPDPKDVGDAHDIYIGFDNPHDFTFYRGNRLFYRIIFFEKDRLWEIMLPDEDWLARFIPEHTIPTHIKQRMKLFLILNHSNLVNRECLINWSNKLTIRGTILHTIDTLMQDVNKGHPESFKKYLDRILDIWKISLYGKWFKSPELQDEATRKTREDLVNELIDICQNENRSEAVMMILRLTKDDEKPATTFRL